MCATCVSLASASSSDAVPLSFLNARTAFSILFFTIRYLGVSGTNKTPTANATGATAQAQVNINQSVYAPKRKLKIKVFYTFICSLN